MMEARLGGEPSGGGRLLAAADEAVRAPKRCVPIRIDDAGAGGFSFVLFFVRLWLSLGLLDGALKRIIAALNGSTLPLRLKGGLVFPVQV
jgi:hypothetical protein